MNTILTTLCVGACAAALYTSPVLAKVQRDPAQVKAFRKDHPCPSSGQRYGKCPGYVVDHVEALACGGRDHPSNMQWQTIADAKLKDRWERIGCRGGSYYPEDLVK